MKRFLFLTGCPRSGTGAAMRVLQASHDIVMPSERFIHRMWSAEGLHPGLFERERFFRQEPGDTFYEFASRAYFRTAQRRFDRARFIGDKIPTLYRRFDQLAERFPGAKVVFILRPVEAVAASYKRRMLSGDPHWTAGGVEQAVRDWNEMVQTMSRPVSGLRLHFLDYDSFFTRAAGIGDLLRFIGTTDARPRLRLLASIVKAARLRQQREDVLTAEDRRHIALEADALGFARLRARYGHGAAL